MTTGEFPISVAAQQRQASGAARSVAKRCRLQGVLGAFETWEAYPLARLAARDDAPIAKRMFHVNICEARLRQQRG